MTAFFNPIIKHKYTADPTVISYGDRVYLYTGHDDPPPGVDDYVMNDWCCFSSNDLMNWEEHPTPLKATDFSWASGDAFASNVVCRDHIFHWYVAVSHRSIFGKAIGVAVSNRPTGPFTDAKGSALITGDMLPCPTTEKANLDPSVVIDDIGQAYLFWGNTTCFYAKLKANMMDLDSDIKVVEVPAFSEGAHVFKRNGWYYLMYGYGFPEAVAYAMSRSVHGPWKFKGIVNKVPYNCETNRPAALDFQGKSYFFYHNGALAGGGSHRRSVCLNSLYYRSDGTIEPIVMTREGITADEG